MIRADTPSEARAYVAHLPKPAVGTRTRRIALKPTIPQNAASELAKVAALGATANAEQWRSR